MAIAAGKFAGKPPSRTDKAFNPPTEAAMAITGNEAAARAAEIGAGRTVDGFFSRDLGLALLFMYKSAP
jgi:hypothetical protein